VLGVQGGFVDDLDQTVLDIYRAYRQPDPEDPGWIWPERYLPICHWGCVVYSVLDCTKVDAPVFFADIGVKDVGAPVSSILIPHRPSFNDWLCGWLDGSDLWKEVWG
jgi:hypothetical protein